MTPRLPTPTGWCSATPRSGRGASGSMSRPTACRTNGKNSHRPRLLRAFTASPAIAPDAFTRELERLEAQRQTALATVAQLEAQERLSVVNQAAAVLTDREQWRRFWLARLNAVGFEQQRDALEGMAVRVQLSNTEIAIEGRLPVGVRQADGSVALQPSTESQHNSTIPFRITVARPKRAA